MLIAHMPKYLTGEISPKNQPHPDRATYSRKLTKQDGTIDWQKPAAEIEREIRAFAGWPQSHTTLGSVDVIITAAHAVPVDDATPGTIEVDDDLGLLIVYTGEGYLCIDGLKPVGKKEMPVKAFLAGYKTRLWL